MPSGARRLDLSVPVWGLAAVTLLLLMGLPLGWLGWGVDGAAIAAALCGSAGCLTFLAISVLGGRPFPWPADRRVRLAAGDFLQMTRIGTPASVSMIARPLSTFLLLKVIASFGTPA